MEQKRFQGEVKWFRIDMGYGFIQLITDKPKVEGQTDDEIFFHYSAIQLDNSEYRTEGHRSLKAGEKVEFTIKEIDGRTQAVDIVKVK
ncbi:cold shock domain-containing protein [Vaccinium witches'-broom phytoplasma]|uniref:cold shock domain-containing protein n=1 Tax=Vaccinium witches'-broom phytoplasma TaxID=85642 RepID=UPI00037A6340|nr:cold shock domain-containing protein [Vaccinium witches'-broom phytoplasma]